MQYGLTSTLIDKEKQKYKNVRKIQLKSFDSSYIDWISSVFVKILSKNDRLNGQQKHKKFILCIIILHNNKLIVILSSLLKMLC